MEIVKHKKYKMRVRDLIMSRSDEVKILYKKHIASGVKSHKMALDHIERLLNDESLRASTSEDAVKLNATRSPEMEEAPVTKVDSAIDFSTSITEDMESAPVTKNAASDNEVSSISNHVVMESTLVTEVDSDIKSPSSAIDDNITSLPDEIEVIPSDIDSGIASSSSPSVGVILSPSDDMEAPHATVIRVFVNDVETEVTEVSSNVDNF